MIILTKQEREFVLGKFQHAELNPTLLKNGNFCLPDNVMLDPAFTEIHSFLNDLPIAKITLADLYQEGEAQPQQTIEPLYDINLGGGYRAEIFQTPRVSKNLGILEFDLIDESKGTRERKRLRIDGETIINGKKDIDLVLELDATGNSLKSIISSVLPLRKDYIISKK